MCFGVLPVAVPPSPNVQAYVDWLLHPEVWPVNPASYGQAPVWPTEAEQSSAVGAATVMVPDRVQAMPLIVTVSVHEYEPTAQ